MDDYVQGDNYGSDTRPSLCFGLSVLADQNAEYEYSLRFNSSNDNNEVYNTISQNPITKKFVKYR